MGGIWWPRSKLKPLAAYWAAWADALPVMLQRRPEVFFFFIFSPEPFRATAAVPVPAAN